MVVLRSGASRAQTIAELRSGIAALSGLPGADAFVGGWGSPEGEALPVPKALRQVLGGVVRRGAVSAIDRPGAVLSALVAETTRVGYVAVVGVSELGLLSVVEQGGDLSRIMCVPDPGVQPFEVLGLLAEGVDLLVVSLPKAPAPSQARPLQARLRKFSTALISIGGGWPGGNTKISSSVEGVVGLCAGGGRIRSVSYSVVVSGTRFPRRHMSWRVGDRGPLESARSVVSFPCSVQEVGA